MNPFNMRPQDFVRHFTIKDKKVKYIGAAIFDTKEECDSEAKKFRKNGKSVRVVQVKEAAIRNYNKKYILMKPEESHNHMFKHDKHQ